MPKQISEKFFEKYKALNEEQKLAVDTIDGALLVIAGPGSGKTQILSLRVANILRLTDVSPDNILCLTFTDSATRNMQERLSQIIGQEAYQVNISTYHAFCGSIINQYSEKFLEDFGMESKPADDLAKHEIITDILGNLSKQNPLSLHLKDEGWFYMRSIQTNISNLKKANIDHQMLEAYLKICDLEIEILAKVIDRHLEVFEINLRPKINIPKAEEGMKLIIEELEQIQDQIGWKSHLAKPIFEKLSDWQKETFENLNYPTLGEFLLQEAFLAWNKYLQEEISLAKARDNIKDWLELDNENNRIFKDKKRIKKSFGLVEVYKQYTEMMRKQKYYDFDDMILCVVKKLNTDKELSYNLSEKYQYILVDEFQDTSGLQLNLINTLCKYEHLIEPNIMVVGDDDQSIYKFQGASTFNILNFQKVYNPNFISLKFNYRSSAKIVDCSRILATLIEDGLTNIVPQINKDIVAHNPFLDSTMHHLTFDSIIEENIWVTKKIKELLKSGVEAEEIAVISAKHKSLKNIVECLEKHRVPINYELGNNILHEPKIAQLITIMKYVCSCLDKDKFDRNDLLVDILAFDCFGIDSIDIYRLASSMKSENWTRSLNQIIIEYSKTLSKAKTEEDSNQNEQSEEDEQNTQSNQEELEIQEKEEEIEYNFEKKINFPKEGLIHNDHIISQSILDLVLFLFELGKKAKQDPGEKIIDFLIGVQVLDEGEENYSEDKNNNKIDALPCGYISKYKKFYFDRFWTKDCSESMKLLSYLQTLVNKIRSFGQGKILYLSEIVAKLELFEQDSGLSIIDKSKFSVGHNSVSILTSHKSKGLEFEYVFLVHCNQSIWHSKPNPDKIGLPKSLPIQMESDTSSDKLRNFYVAITRAKKHLYITNYTQNDSKQENHLVFLDSLPHEKLDQKRQVRDSDLQYEAIHLASQKKAPNIILNYDQKTLLEGKLKDYTLSVTHLNNFLDMKQGGPKKFLETNLLRFPATRSNDASYGSAVHLALSETYKTASILGQKPHTEILIQNFEIALSLEKILFKDREKIKEKGRIELTTFWQRKELEKNYETEKSFSYGVSVDNARLKGNIDKIVFDYDNRLALVLDYKTGKHGTPQEYKRKKAGKYNGEFGEFRFLKNYNQLVFYRLLIENSKDYKNRFWVKKGGLEFVNCTETKNIPIVLLDITDEDEQRLRKLIQSVWGRIMKLDFSIPSDFRQDYDGTLDWIHFLLDQ
jgi:superfamily I DNA/RNA helicase